MLGTGLLYANSGSTSLDGLYIITSISDISSGAENLWYKPYYINLVRRCVCVYSLCKLQIYFSKIYQTPDLGQRGNPWLNIACLEEKVQTEPKRIGWMLRPVKVVMVRAIQPQNQYPVPSNIGERRVRNESFDSCAVMPKIDNRKETNVMRYTKSIIKDMNGWPKTTSFCITRTTVSTKGGNSHVAGGLGVAARSAYGMLNGIRRRSSPVANQSREFSTSIVLAKNVMNKLDSLHKIAQSTNGKINGWKLYKDFMLNPEMYLAAYQKLRSKPGNMTPGINPTTLDGLSETVIHEIINKLRKGDFQFNPGRRVEIPKQNGKTRPLTVGSPRDKLVQEVMRMVLEAIYEPMFMENSHGFRPNRSCHSALRQIFSKFTGCTWWIEGDIKACFDSIPHDSLMKVLQKRIEDQRFLELIRKALNAGYLHEKQLRTDIVGTPQGSIISPILANIYMHELDLFVDSLKREFDSSGKRPRNNESLRIKYHIDKAKKMTDPIARRIILQKLITRYKSIDNKVVGEHSKKLMYVRYADDWVVAINGTFAQATEILKRIRIYCKDQLGLEVSEEKTKITNAYKDHVLFLGTKIKHATTYTFSRRKGIVQRNRKTLLLTAPMGKIKKKLMASGFIMNGRGKTRTTWIPLEPRQVVHLANTILRGYLNYYSFAHNKNKLSPWLYWIIRETVLRTLSRKLNLGSRAKVIKRFGTNVTITDLTKRDKDGKPQIVAELYKPEYRINCLNFKVKQLTEIPALYSRGISIASLDNLECKTCGSTYRVEMHHVKMMKDLNPKINDLDKLMVKANRKQIPLCRKCHMEHHKNNSKQNETKL